MEPSERDQQIAAVQFVLDTLRANPKLPVPYIGVMPNRLDSLKDFKAAIKAYGGKWEKEQDDNDFQMRRVIAPGISLLLYINHEKVCKKVVVGKKQIAEVVVPACEEKVIPAHEIEIVKWVCPESVLA